MPQCLRAWLRVVSACFDFCRVDFFRCFTWPDPSSCPSAANRCLMDSARVFLCSRFCGICAICGSTQSSSRTLSPELVPPAHRFVVSPCTSIIVSDFVLSVAAAVQNRYTHVRPARPPLTHGRVQGLGVPTSSHVFHVTRATIMLKRLFHGDRVSNGHALGVLRAPRPKQDRSTPQFHVYHEIPHRRYTARDFTCPAMLCSSNSQQIAGHFFCGETRCTRHNPDNRCRSSMFAIGSVIAPRARAVFNG